MSFLGAIASRRMDDQATTIKSYRALALSTLRIIISGLFATICVCLIVLWFRSFTTCDGILAKRGRGVLAGAVSLEGQVYLFTYATGTTAGQRRVAMPIDDASFVHGKFVSSGPEFRIAPPGTFIVASHWLAAAWLATLAVLCWVPLSMKFNIRTMLVATTLLALLMGAAVYAIK